MKSIFRINFGRQLSLELLSSIPGSGCGPFGNVRTGLSGLDSMKNQIQSIKCETLRKDIRPGPHLSFV